MLAPGLLSLSKELPQNTKGIRSMLQSTHRCGTSIYQLIVKPKDLRTFIPAGLPGKKHIQQFRHCFISHDVGARRQVLSQFKVRIHAKQ